VRSAIDNAVPPGILDVWGIKRLGDRWIPLKLPILF
jgi:hypothetical protein